MSFLIPRRERGLVVGEAEQILGEVETRVGEPFRPLFRIGRTHVVESDSHTLGAATGAAVPDYAAESPCQRPEALRIVDRPFMELPVRIGRIVGHRRPAALLHVAEELGHVRLDYALGRWSPERIAHLFSCASPLTRWWIELGVLTLQPRLVIIRVFNIERRLGDFQRSEAIRHDCELVGVLGANARLRASRMGTMRNSIRVVRDAAELDSLAAHELARRVVKHFVGVDVAVIVRRRNRFRMEIIGTWTERANHESITLEGLMNRRRLVNAPDDRLEIADVERPWIEISVPANDVQRMVIENDLVDAVVLLHQNREISHLV